MMIRVLSADAGRFAPPLGVLLGAVLGCSGPEEREPADGYTSEADASAAQAPGFTARPPADCPAMDVPGGGGGVAPAEPPEAAVFRIPLRVHVGRSGLSGDALGDFLEEMNAIWLAQAGVCFEIHTVEDDDRMDDGFDLFVTASRIPDASSRTNGVYRGDHDIWTLDDPDLSPSPNPVDHDAARTAAHELGHGLGLSHQNCGRQCPCEASLGRDCDDFLMRSGTTGFFLSELEIATARRRAAEKALGDTTLSACVPPAVD